VYNKEMPRNPASHTCPIVTLEEEKVLVTLMLWRWTLQSKIREKRKEHDSSTFNQ